MVNKNFNKRKKSRKRIYKKHKQWVMATTVFISAVSFFSVGTGNVHAQTTDSKDNGVSGQYYDSTGSVTEADNADSETDSALSTYENDVSSNENDSSQALSNSAAIVTSANINTEVLSNTNVAAKSGGELSTSSAINEITQNTDSTTASNAVPASSEDTAISSSSAEVNYSLEEVANKAVNIITEPSDLNEDQYATWLSYAKEQASIDYQLTGRAQEIIMSDATTLHITIGSSNIPRVDAVDVASYQSWMTQSDFNKLKSLGVKSVIVKVTEGSTYTNPYAKSEINMALAAGLNVDVYHYAKFASAGSAKSEANHLLSVLNNFGLSKGILIFADMEDTSTYSSSIGSFLNTFWNVLDSAGYTNHGVYTFVSYKYATQVKNTVGDARTWMAQYPYTPTSGTNWNTSYGAWQFSSTAYLPNSNNAIDVSVDYMGLFLLKSIAYDKIESTKSVNYSVLINESTRNDGLFANGPYMTSAETTSFSAGTAKGYNNQWATVTEEAVTKRATWVKVTFGNGQTYWMDKSGIAQVSFDVIWM